MCDRLVRKGLVSRRRASADRRTVRVTLAPSGRDVVADVTRSRRAELATVLARLPQSDRSPVLAALRGFASAAGELPEQEWSLGWCLGTGSAAEE
jgi:DNA-binding MarR family transcriptional regulator